MADEKQKRKKIPNEVVPVAYRLAKQVYEKEGEITFTEAKEKLVNDYGLNEHSAADYINNFRCLREGQIFKRTHNAFSFEYFLENIHSDYGDDGLKSALRAFSLHISYVENQAQKVNAVQFRKIYGQFAAKLSLDSTDMNLGVTSHDLEVKRKPNSKEIEATLNSINTYLFAWNPNNWPWKELEENIEELQNSGSVKLRWSCRSHKSVKVGDRAFLVRLGSSPRGIMASGTVVSLPFLAGHWSGEEKQVERVIIEFDAILNPSKSPILPLHSLLPSQNWTPQSSGISISKEASEDLEKKWFEFLNSQEYSPDIQTKDVVMTPTFFEGASREVTQTFRERNPHARKECLETHGYKCAVCCFDFEEQYGLIGREFIHVHHLNMVSSRKGEYQVKPAEDLRPVCPNCHAMIHKRNPPYSIEDVKDLINTNFCAPQT